MFPGPRLVLSDDIPSISCKDLALCGLLERMNFHPGTSYPLEPARKSLLERALHYSCDFGVAYALLLSHWSMDPGDAEKHIDECRSVHNTTRQDFSVNGAPSGMIPRRMCGTYGAIASSRIGWSSYIQLPPYGIGARQNLANSHSSRCPILGSTPTSDDPSRRQSTVMSGRCSFLPRRLSSASVLSCSISHQRRHNWFGWMSSA